MGMLVGVSEGMLVGVFDGMEVGVEVGVRDGVGVCGTGWKGVRVAVNVANVSWSSRAKPALPDFNGVMVGDIVGEGGANPRSIMTSDITNWLLNCCRLASGLPRK